MVGTVMEEEVEMLEKEAREKYKQIWKLLNEIGHIYTQIDHYNGKTKIEFTPEQLLNQGRNTCPSCG